MTAAAKSAWQRVCCFEEGWRVRSEILKPIFGTFVKFDPNQHDLRTSSCNEKTDALFQQHMQCEEVKYNICKKPHHSGVKFRVMPFEQN